MAQSLTSVAPGDRPAMMSLSVGDDSLADASNWTVTIPASATSTLERAGFQCTSHTRLAQNRGHHVVAVAVIP